MVSVFFGWEFTSFLDDAVPAIVGAVLVDFFGGHFVLMEWMDEIEDRRRPEKEVLLGEAVVICSSIVHYANCCVLRSWSSVGGL